MLRDKELFEKMDETVKKREHISYFFQAIKRDKENYYSVITLELVEGTNPPLIREVDSRTLLPIGEVSANDEAPKASVFNEPIALTDKFTVTMKSAPIAVVTPIDKEKEKEVDPKDIKEV